MSKTTKFLIAAGFIAFLGFIVYSTTGLGRVNCEVCIEFRGRMSCRPGAGTTRQEAVQTATTVACVDIASGREESTVCSATPPQKVTCTTE
jgi:hypothetical protein